MKKLLVLVLLVTLASCTGKQKDSDVCDGYLELDGCTAPSFDICGDDCNDSVEANKYYSFTKAQAFSTYSGTYFSDLQLNNTISGEPEVALAKTDLESLQYKSHQNFYYSYFSDIRNDYFGMSTNIELCSDQNIVSGCELNLANNRTIRGHFQYGTDTFEVKWHSTIDNSEYNLDTALLLRANTSLSDFDFEFIREESGDIYDVLRNTYSFNYEGVMKVYSHSITKAGEETIIYYMYDTNTGNSVKYVDTHEEFHLEYYIASHQKMYTIQKFKSINLELYGVTYYDETQDYVSVRAIRQDDVFIAIQESYNMNYVSGWDVANHTTDELFFNDVLLDLNGYTMNPIGSDVSGTSPYRITIEYALEAFKANEMNISNELSFDEIEFSVVDSDIENIMLNFEGYHNAFDTDFGSSINQNIITLIKDKQLHND